MKTERHILLRIEELSNQLQSLQSARNREMRKPYFFRSYALLNFLIREIDQCQLVMRELKLVLDSE